MPLSQCLRKAIAPADHLTLHCQHLDYEENIPRNVFLTLMICLWTTHSGSPVHAIQGACLKCQFPGPHTRFAELIFLKMGFRIPHFKTSTEDNSDTY
jgi:hypothetical protein